MSLLLSVQITMNRIIGKCKETLCVDLTACEHLHFSIQYIIVVEHTMSMHGLCMCMCACADVNELLSVCKGSFMCMCVSLHV